MVRSGDLQLLVAVFCQMNLHPTFPLCWPISFPFPLLQIEECRLFRRFQVLEFHSVKELGMIFSAIMGKTILREIQHFRSDL